MTDVMDMEDKRVVWTEDRLQAVKAMWGRGSTAQFIADQFPGVTRNTICGLVHRNRFTRLNIHPEPSPKHSEPAVGGAPNLQRARRIVAKVEAEKAAAPFLKIVCDPIELESLHLTMDQLQDHHCRWPELDGPEQTYCGHAVKPDRPYCTMHCAKAYEPPPVRKGRVSGTELSRARGGVFGRGRSA